jgi:hypothetical protein
MDRYAPLAAVYEEWSAQMTEDVPFYIDRARQADGLGLIDVAGLEVEALYGWFDMRPFDDESREFVWVARKPE